tara:strand:- start:2221 stop:3060 length:840 start_codon:yes stop_codon:yes gene_type:complete
MTLSAFKIFLKKELCFLYNDDEIQIIFFELIDSFLKISKIKYITDYNKVLLDRDIISLNNKINQLKDNMPIQYVVGKKKIFGINFKLNKNVLIPRPETEELCSWIISHELCNLKVLDIGTGSGLIALVLKKKLKNCDVEAWDSSAKAVEIAKLNAINNNIDISIKTCDIFNEKIPINKFNLIVSNPPYVSYDDFKNIHERVKRYEPNNAIFVNNEDPLIYYKCIIQKASISLTSNGFIFFECCQKKIDDVKNILINYNFKNIEIKRDFREMKRMIKAEK